MKTRILLAGLLSAFYVFSLNAQTITQDRQVGSFEGVASSSGIDVFYAEGVAGTIKVEAEPVVIDKIETTVKDGILVIKVKDRENIRTRQKMAVYVTAPTLGKISMSGGADFKAGNLRSAASIKINSSGGSDITIDKLEAGDIQIDLSGGADADIKSLKANSLNLAASGGSDANLTVDVTSVDAKASGGADIKLVGKTKSLIIKCSGGSDGNIRDLKYETIDLHKSGGANIKK